MNRRCNPVSNAKVDVWYAGGNPGKYKNLKIITHQEKIEHKMHCLIISVGYTFPPDYLWYRGSATADKVLKYYVIVLYFLHKMVFGMYIIARGGKSQLVLARPSCVFFWLEPDCH